MHAMSHAGYGAPCFSVVVDLRQGARSLLRFVRPMQASTVDHHGTKHETTFNVWPHPLYAQDFLTVFRPDAL